MKASNTPWIWVPREILLAVHAEQLAEHGGLQGVRDSGMLESALARPRQLHAYEPAASAAQLAAAYAFGIARNHPFADGNKRAAFLAGGLFLLLNGLQLIAEQADAALTVPLAVSAET